MPQNVFFTSDSHFGHQKIIEYCNRPFQSVDEMNNHLIWKWNEVVKDGDVVYHLGDFAFYHKKAEVTALLSKLAGNKVLIAGNHDHGDTRHAHGWAAVHEMYDFSHKDVKIALCHFPMLEWHKKQKGAYHLFGHVHNTITHVEPNKAMDVGVDAVGFSPLSLTQVLERLNS